MAKLKIPKKVGAYKIPKAIRKNPILQGMLANKVGRDVLAKALVAGAGAAAAVLVEDRKDVADTAKTTGRKGAKALGLVGEAFYRASDAAVDVVRDAAGDMLPKKFRKQADENPRKGAAVH
ncbi:hypothetical protein HFO15_35430 [Rhizobium laguerreae]|uniref:hypothetical protein n=1 Tax=Rhizobium laguerreae TaxID=1076926 RepID=UPI001C91ACFC|nr:hypothetical protein [Rhizobium laguerreae]MBY3266852.1 hypothetical protein [Rhizobium laguerreae]